MSYNKVLVFNLGFEKKSDFDEHWIYLPEKKYNYYRDTHQVYHLMLAGKCAILNMMGGMYNITGCGEHSHRDAINQLQMTLAVDTELWKLNHDLRWKSLCIRVMQSLIDIYDGRNNVLFLKYALKIFFFQFGIRKFLKN